MTQTDDLAAQMVWEMLPAINSVSDLGYIEDIARRYMEKGITAQAEEIERLRAALKPFARIADMEERADSCASVIVNVDRCRDARAALKAAQEAKA